MQTLQNPLFTKTSLHRVTAEAIAPHPIQQHKSSGRQKTLAHQNYIVWTLFDQLSTTFILL
jgi:hypothetical protein